MFNINNTHINQYDTSDLSLIKVHANLIEASENTGVSKANIARVLKLGKGQAGGYFWLNACDSHLIGNFTPTKSVIRKLRKVRVYNAEGELLNIYDSQAEASLDLGIKQQLISTSAKNHTVFRKVYQFRLLGDRKPVRKLKEFKYPKFIYDLEGNYLLEVNNIKDIPENMQPYVKEKIKKSGLLKTPIKVMNYQLISKGYEQNVTNYLNKYVLFQDSEQGTQFIGDFSTLKEISDRLQVSTERVRQTIYQTNSRIQGVYFVEKKKSLS